MEYGNHDHVWEPDTRQVFSEETESMVDVEDNLCTVCSVYESTIDDTNLL